jgi:uncharacterized protein (DUF4415 family)
MKTSIHIRLDDDILHYFRVLSDRTGYRYQSLINLCLLDALSVKWHDSTARKHIPLIPGPDDL